MNFTSVAPSNPFNAPSNAAPASGNGQHPSAAHPAAQIKLAVFERFRYQYRQGTPAGVQGAANLIRLTTEGGSRAIRRLFWTVIASGEDLWEVDVDRLLAELKPDHLRASEITAKLGAQQPYIPVQASSAASVVATGQSQQLTARDLYLSWYWTRAHILATYGPYALGEYDADPVCWDASRWVPRY